MRYAYTFQVWPDETKDWGKDGAIFDLFKMFGRVEMEFTEPVFNLFRARLAANMLTLREISRVPYTEPETVL